MFMHGGLMHLLFNMLGLWMFGTTIERVWGPKRFLIFYFICGVGAALAQLAAYAYDFRGVDAYSSDVQMYLTSQYTATVGASGAIMGILAAFGYLFPNTTLFIMPIPFPVKAKWAIIGIIAIDIFSGLSRIQGDNIAHFAHVGGAVIGFLIVLYWNKTNKQTFY
jgi:membrane associated rhomboid family serine protease